MLNVFICCPLLVQSGTDKLDEDAIVSASRILVHDILGVAVAEQMQEELVGVISPALQRLEWFEIIVQSV